MAKKILKRSLALGALMAFVITGSAMAADSDPINESKVIKDSITIKNKMDSIFLERKDNNNKWHYTTFGVSANNADVSIVLTGPNINIETTAEHNEPEIPEETRSVYASGGGKIALGEKGVSDIIIKAITPNKSSSIMALSGGQINIEAKSLKVESAGTFGIHVQNSTETVNAPSGASSIKIDADTIDIKSSFLGISAFSNGQMNINGDLSVDAINAIDVRGNSTVNINLDGAHTTKLNGDIVFETPNDPTDAQNSGKIINAYVNINFNGPESYWNGRSYQEYKVKTGVNGEGKDIYEYRQIVELQKDPYHGNLTGFKLAFNNGATWKVTDESCVNEVTFGKDAKLVINGSDFTNKYAVTTNKLTMDPTATVVINGSVPNTLYKVVKGENNISDTNLDYDRTVLFAEETTNDGSVYEVSFKPIDDTNLAAAQGNAVAATGGDALAAPGIIKGAIGSDAPAGAKDLVSAITSSGASIDQKAEMVNAVAKIGEAGGTTANAASVVNNVTGITTQRMSFTNVSTTPQGGHGKVERKYKSGAGVWAQYMHGKDKVEDMPSAGGANSYDSQYNGAVIGYDFKEVGKTHSGISFNYGEGDSHSKDSIVSTRNDFDFWGVGAYTSIMNDDTNLIFDINYNKSDADVKQIVAGHEVTVNPNTTSLSVGVKAEKLIQNGPVQIVPYAGARFLTIDTDEYTSSAGTVYAPERQNIWLIPVGVSLRQENVYENGWKVTPKADLSYIWALGDTDSSMTVTTGAASDPIAYTVMDNGSFLGTLGIEAAKGDWTYGLSYSYQKGEYQRSDKWFVDVRYSF